MTLEEIKAELKEIVGFYEVYFLDDGEIELEGAWTAEELRRVLELHAAYMELMKKEGGNEG